MFGLRQFSGSAGPDLATFVEAIFPGFAGFLAFRPLGVKVESGLVFRLLSECGLAFLELSLGWSLG